MPPVCRVQGATIRPAITGNALSMILSRLPRTYIDTGSAEGFRDEILIYASRLSEAGVSVDLHMWGRRLPRVRPDGGSCSGVTRCQRDPRGVHPAGA
jgi:hypothetical protein